MYYEYDYEYDILIILFCMSLQEYQTFLLYMYIQKY